jgi:hypothetical protein
MLIHVAKSWVGFGKVIDSYPTHQFTAQARSIMGHCTGFSAHFCTFGVNAHLIFDNSHLSSVW